MNTENKPGPSSPDGSLERRHFMRGAVGGLMLVTPQVAFGYQANSNVEFGLIGCGSRGFWITPLFVEHTGAKPVAVADVVKENLTGFQAKHGIASNRSYYGPDAYRELAGSKVDAVVIETPPYYHPLHAAAAVASGKHVFLAKPAAVDVPGCKEIVQAGQAAARAGRSFWIDFQIRAQDSFREATERVQRGDIGKPVFGQAYFHGTRSLARNYPGLDPEMERLKNHYSDPALGGGILVEQGVHVIDAMNWYMGAHPVKAFGTGGRADWSSTPHDVRNEGWDHYAVTYWYPNGAHVLCSEAQLGPGAASGGIVANCFGIHGTLESRYNGMIRIYGSKPWRGVEKDATMNQGTAGNIRTFIRSIREGKPVNNAETGAESTLSGVLGREAARREAILSWDELMRSTERYSVNLKLRY